jgi:hypothetical protein
MRRINEYIKKMYRTFVFLFHLIIKENTINYVKKSGPNNMCSSKKLVILANGPSLSNVLKNWRSNDTFKDSDFAAMNYFCHDRAFIEIRPKYYILSDPHFFQDNSLLKEKADKMYATLNGTVTWKMFLYIQYYAKSIDWSTKIQNENIKIIPFHSLIYTGYDRLRNLILKYGLSSGNYGSVVLNAELIGLNLGYKELHLYGVDHDFFNDLVVDENNQVCNRVTYFYDNSSNLKPITHYYIPGKETKYTISEYLREKACLFYGHEVMRMYADYCSAKIYNCTRESLIDAYERPFLHSKDV